MPRSTPSRGTIWSVPSIGTNARAFVLFDAAGLARGRPEYTVVPVYDTVPGSTTSLDFRLEPQDSTLGTTVYAALWNARPIAAEDLGEEIGTIVEDQVTTALRDSYLRLVDPSIDVSLDRLGRGELTDSLRAWRRDERQAWQRLTARVLNAAVSRDSQFDVIAAAPVVPDRCQFALYLKDYVVNTANYGVLASESRIGSIDPNQIPAVVLDGMQFYCSYAARNVLPGRVITINEPAYFIGIGDGWSMFSTAERAIRQPLEAYPNIVIGNVEVASGSVPMNNRAVSAPPMGEAYAGAA